MTSTQVSLEQMCLGGSRTQAGLRDCPQEAPVSFRATLVSANILPEALLQCLHWQPLSTQELRGAQHTLSLAGQVTASFACSELPTLLSIPALGPVWMEPAAPGADVHLCQALSHLPGRASHTCWEGDRSWATSLPLQLSG